MANQTKRLKPALIQADMEAFAALQAMEGYAPANPAYTVAAIKQAHDNMTSAQTAETQAEATAASARDTAVAGEWEFHNLILGSKDQVTAQFGRNSNQVQSVGIKKSSERKAPTRTKRGGGESK
jgi:hypothetical protein